MKAIFSFKFQYTYEGYDEQRFFNYARLAVLSASKFHKTHLYCDKKSEYYFQKLGIKFDQVTVLPEIENYNGDIFSMCKIYAMRQETEPYVHLDFDTFTNAPYSTSTVIGFGYPELDYKNREMCLENIRYFNRAYYKPYLDKIQGKIFDVVETTFDWRVIPNNSAIIVNNPKLIKTIFESIEKKYSELIHTNEGYGFSAMYIEQFLLARYLDYHKVDYSFIYPQSPIILKSSHTYKVFDETVTFTTMEAKTFLLNTVRFAHFHGYRNFPAFSGVVDKLYEDYKPKQAVL